MDLESFSKSSFHIPQPPKSFAAMPVGETEMGLSDIAMRTLVFWTPLKREMARLQVLMKKEELHFLSNATQPLLFIFHFE